MGFEPTTLRDLVGCSMVSKGRVVGLDWNRITRLHMYSLSLLVFLFGFFLFFFHFIGDMLSKRYLKFASFNVEGLRNKLDDINFKNEISKFDFITLVET